MYLQNPEYFVYDLKLIAEIFKNSNFKISFTENNLWIFFDSDFYSNRYPCFNLNPINKNEIEEFFKKNKKTLILSYNLLNNEISTESHFLYKINKNKYSVDNLPSSHKRAVNKGNSAFIFDFKDWNYIRKFGFKCFNDTRNRIGFNDARLESFEKTIDKYESFENCLPYCAILKENESVTSFQPILIYQNYAEIFSTYSDNDFLELRPNDSIFYSVINRLFNQSEVNLISYGLSSVENIDQLSDSLHKFKVKVGFEPVPIKRIFILNPRYKLIFNPLTNKLIDIFSKIFKKNKLLVKLAFILKNLNKDD